MHWTTVAKVETGRRSVRIVEASALADLFGISVDELLGRNANPEGDQLQTLRLLIDTARELSHQISGVTETLRNRFRDIDGLTIDGVDWLKADSDRAWCSLTDASKALSRIAMFETRVAAQQPESPDEEGTRVFARMVWEGVDRETQS